MKTNLTWTISTFDRTCVLINYFKMSLTVQILDDDDNPLSAQESDEPNLLENEQAKELKRVRRRKRIRRRVKIEETPLQQLIRLYAADLVPKTAKIINRRKSPSKPRKHH